MNAESSSIFNCLSPLFPIFLFECRVQLTSALTRTAKSVVYFVYSASLHFTQNKRHFRLPVMQDVS